MKILLTGAAGQVGHALLPLLQGKYELVLPRRDQMNLTDPAQIRAVVGAVQPDCIINAAAYTAVDQAEREPALAIQVNAHAPALLAEEARRLGALLVHFSTDYVFDGLATTPYTEQDACNPLNAYGRSKREGELAIEAAGARSLVLRTQWIYGLHGRNFLLTMLGLAAQRDELRVVNDQFGAPTWAPALARAVVRVLQAGQGQDDAWWQERSGIYHLVAQGETSWHGFASRIIGLAGLPRPPRVTGIPTADYPTPARRPMRGQLSCAKFERDFGFALPDWETSLEECMQIYRQSASTN
ncbi:MAG: rfbD [Paucimonas sp.]|nr:rfbD [Paucimonas sp.]